MAPRRQKARHIRDEAAQLEFLQPHVQHPNNGEEDDYPYVANYSKGLPHNNVGKVDHNAYHKLLKAVHSGQPHDFENIPLAPLAPADRHRRLINPQAGVDFDLEGPDSHALTIPPAPRIDGAQASAEMAELYWMALLRDVSFIDYGTGTGTDIAPATTSQAANSLSTFTGYQGPPTTSATAGTTLFRGTVQGDQVGPYLSQFLIKDIPYGPNTIVQKQETPVAGSDFMTSFDTPQPNNTIWLNIQKGAQPDLPIQLDATPRFIRNLRDLAYHVRIDISYQHYLNACLILQHMNLPPTEQPAGPLLTAVDAPPCMSGPLDPGNPYLPASYPPHTQEGFATFGNWHIPSLLAEAATRALTAAWYQKWFVHRRLRPEEFGGLIDSHLSGRKAYPMIHHEILDALHSNTGSLFPHYGLGKTFPSYLLPQAFPEGSPLHPSYPEGHATVAGACVTILKAFFDEDYPFDPASTNPFEQPEEPDGDGMNKHLLPPGGPQLTVGGELNKLAANISLGGRGGAGVHYRSDCDVSLVLGEQVAIGILREQQFTYTEKNLNGQPPFFTFRSFFTNGLVVI